MCSKLSCTSCLSNNDIQTPDQVSVPCTTPYFHKDTLTTPSSSRSPPLEEAGPVRMRPAMHLYITHALYFEIYTTLLEVIQLMSIAGYEAFVCVCFLKHYVQPYILLPWDAHSRPYVYLYCLKKSFNTLNLITKKVLEQERRKHFKNEQKVGILLQKKNRYKLEE